jgi:hypothetical protein
MAFNIVFVSMFFKELLFVVFLEKSKVIELGFDFHFEVKFDYFFSSILNVGIFFVFLLFFSFGKILVRFLSSRIVYFW